MVTVSVLPDRSGFPGHQCILLQLVWRQFQRVSEPRKNGTNYSGDLEFGKIWNPDFLKVRFQIVQFSNGWAFATATAIVPTIQNFCQDFKWFLTKCRQFVRISNGWASRFNENRTIYNPTCFRPFKIKTNSNRINALTFMIN